jgi:hypothetical protein
LVSNDYYIKSKSTKDRGTFLLEELYSKGFDRCCFEKCWKEKSKGAGHYIDSKTGKWVKGGQFLSGDWWADLESFMIMSGIYYNIEAGEGLTLILDILSAMYPWFKAVKELGEKTAEGIIGIVIPSDHATPDQMAANWRMGKDYDEAANNFWDLVEECVDQCRKGTGGVGPRPGVIGPGDYVNSIGNSGGSLICFN